MEILDPDCLPCAANYHLECPELQFEAEVLECCCNPGAITPAATGGWEYKKDAEVKDPKSTGRKRAAQLYPIDENNPGPCEWQGLKKAGGGLYPIIGCIDGVAVHRHHGPDKDTLNNSMGNVHRICHHCHNRWHTLNDPVYATGAGTSDWKAHDPKTQATKGEQVLNEGRWNANKSAHTNYHTHEED